MTRLRNRGSWWPVLKQFTKPLYFEFAPIQWKSLICLQGNWYHCWPFLVHLNSREWYSLSILVSCTVTILHATAVIFLLFFDFIVDHNFMRHFNMHGDVFADRFLSFFVYFSSCDIYLFFDCRCAVSLGDWSVQCSVFSKLVSYSSLWHFP